MSSSSVARRGAWPSSATCPARPWCWGAPSRRSSSAALRCGSGAWSWPGGAAGEEPSISGRGSSSGWTPGSRGTTRSGSLDVSVAAEWVGAWWMTALAGLRVSGASTSTPVARCRGSSASSSASPGAGPVEVFQGVRKVVGLSQWRAREGALFSSCAYLHWDPAPLAGAPAIATIDARAGLARDLAPLAVGLAELDPPVADLERVRDLCWAPFASFAYAAADGRPAPGGRRPGSALSRRPPFLLPSLPFPAGDGLRPVPRAGVVRPGAVAERRCGAGDGRPRRQAAGRAGVAVVLQWVDGGCGVEGKGVKWRAVV